MIDDDKRSFALRPRLPSPPHLHHHGGAGGGELSKAGGRGSAARNSKIVR